MELDVDWIGDEGVGYSILVTSQNGFVVSVDLVMVRVGRAIVLFEGNNGDEPLPIGPELLEAVVERLEDAL